MGQGTHRTKMGADNPAENSLKKIQPKIFAQAQKFEIFEKKLCVGVRSRCSFT